ncbi:hypothetical protein BKA63DRAFT_497458 [Paraphoma chrysanthemicola]|nr:hypothetical protein BKA63DRAFT_497458 [Paraphoma chrysanthemicola]
MPTTTYTTCASRRELRDTFTAFTSCNDQAAIDYYLRISNHDIGRAINHYYDLNQPAIPVQRTAVPAQQTSVPAPHPRASNEGAPSTASQYQQGGERAVSIGAATTQVHGGMFGGTSEAVLGRVTGIAQNGPGIVLRTVGRALQQGYRGLLRARDAFQQARPTPRRFGDALLVACFILLSLHPSAGAATNYQARIMWWGARRLARAIVRRWVFGTMRIVSELIFKLRSVGIVVRSEMRNSPKVGVHSLLRVSLVHIQIKRVSLVHIQIKRIIAVLHSSQMYSMHSHIGSHRTCSERCTRNPHVGQVIPAAVARQASRFPKCRNAKPNGRPECEPARWSSITLESPCFSSRFRITCLKSSKLSIFWKVDFSSWYSQVPNPTGIVDDAMIKG